MNHPKDKSCKDFICQAFPKIKYYDIGVSEPAPKFKLRKEDLFPAIAGIQMCCFLKKSAPRTRAYQDTTAPHAP